MPQINDQKIYTEYVIRQSTANKLQVPVNKIILVIDHMPD